MELVKHSKKGDFMAQMRSILADAEISMPGKGDILEIEGDGLNNLQHNKNDAPKRRRGPRV